MSTIDPNAELFDAEPSSPRAAPPASAPPPQPVSDADDDGYDAEDAREREIEGGRGGGSTLHLSVTDPQQIGEGRSAHTYYRIDVRQDSSNSFADPIASVRRRYSDFQWLFQRLHAEKPGSIVPIIPHTQAVQMTKRMSEELIEERRGHLEAFLRKVQVHPELEGAPSLSAFFSPDAEVFEAAKKANPGNDVGVEDATTTEKATEKMKHFFVKVGIKAQVARGVGGLEETPGGARMEEVEHYLTTLESQIKSLAKATLYLVNSSKDTSANMHELGQCLFGLHQTYNTESNSDNGEEEAAASSSKNSHLPTIKAISNVFASLSAINKVKHDEDSAKVGARIHELEWSIKAARLALKRRKNCQLTYTTYLQQIKNRDAAVDKLTKAGEHAKLGDAQKLLDAAKQSSSKALEDLNEVTQRVLREMDRFKRMVDDELRALYVAHAKIQADYANQLDTEWRKMVPGTGANGGTIRRTGSNGAGSVASKGSGEAEMLMI